MNLKLNFAFYIYFFASIVMANDSLYDWRPIEKSTLSSGINATGRVVPQDGALNIESARVQGRVLGILRREGELVKAGTPLYSISSSECFSLAEEKRLASSKKIVELSEGVAKRERQLGLKLEKDLCYAVASNSGILTKRNLESGAAFNIGDAIATTLDTKRLTIELDVPERDQSEVHRGQKVNFRFASNPSQTFTTQVQNVVPTIDPTTRTSKARLIPASLPKNVSMDALVFGEIEVGSQELLLKIPSTALVFYHNEQYVIAGGDEHPMSVAVKVLSENDSKSAVRPLKLGMLKEGDLVATKSAIFLFKKLMTENSKK